MIARMAFRNLLRNRRRTLITLSAIAFGSASLLATKGFFRGLTYMLREVTIHSGLGHVEVRARGLAAHRTTDPLRYLMRDFDRVEGELRSIRGYRGTVRSIDFGGLLTTDDASVAVLGVGIDPEAEARLMSGMEYIAGKALTPDDPLGALVGKGLAAALGLKVGDSVTLLTSTRDGGINGRSLVVRGIYATGLQELDDRTIRVPLATAQTLLDVENMVMRGAVVLERTEDTPSAVEQVRGRIRATNLDVEAVPWYELADFYDKVVRFLGTVYRVIATIVAVVMLLGISNTMSMAVFERTREIGTALAIGTPPTSVVRTFLFEGFFVGVLGAALGVCAALAIEAVLGNRITLPPPPGATLPVDVELMIETRHVFSTAMVCLVAALISSVLPAIRAARLNVTAALRYV